MVCKEGRAPWLSVDMLTLRDRSTASWSLSSNWEPKASPGRRRSSPSTPLYWHGIGWERVHSQHRNMNDRLAGRMSMQRNRGRWDPERSRMGREEPCWMSNGRRKCAHTGGNAMAFVRFWRSRWFHNSHASTMSHGQSCEGRERSARRTRRSKKPKRR